MVVQYDCRERVCVNVCIGTGRVRESGFVFVQLLLCVCVCACARVCICICMCVRERQREKLLKHFPNYSHVVERSEELLVRATKGPRRD